MPQIKLMLVDDHPIVRAGFHRLLLTDHRIDVVGEASCSNEAVERYQELNPDIVLMDLNMPTNEQTDSVVSSNGGLDAIRRIIEIDSEAKILVLTVMEADPFPTHVLSAGAKGYLTKRCAPGELLEAVLTVHNGDTYIAEGIAIAPTGDKTEETSVVSKLTKREFQVFTLLAEGKSVAQIADEVYLSVKTVHAHRTNIFRKLDLKTNTDIVHLGIRMGIVQA